MKTTSTLAKILGVKGFLCLASMTMITLALTTYTATVTIVQTQQFTVGATSTSWTIYVNAVNETRYLPGSGSPAGSEEPTFNASDFSTCAFKVATDADRVCAVKIELTSAVNNSKFSKFEITLKHWNGSAWDAKTLYDAATGSTTKSYIDGLTSGDAGYIHHGMSETVYYLIRVTYSYDQVDETTQTTVTFQYTPLPQDSF
ncbi:MAG: hypothetical protein OEZ29_02970 [Candidatus Bathyarchaeota archaeon]|nr:hypothetical protein [Candidatus Bathyarchaeota archaeon]MDH5779538.1 hypothetical protein [Candidatus Bathyarchaeota archaeon]